MRKTREAACILYPTPVPVPVPVHFRRLFARWHFRRGRAILGVRGVPAPFNR